MDGIETDQIASEVERGDLLIPLLGDGVRLDGPGTDGIERFELIASLEQLFTLLDRLLALDDAVQLIKLVVVQSEGNTELTDAAILAMNCTATALDTSARFLFRDHRLIRIIDLYQTSLPSTHPFWIGFQKDAIPIQKVCTPNKMSSRAPPRRKLRRVSQYSGDRQARPTQTGWAGCRDQKEHNERPAAGRACHRAPGQHGIDQPAGEPAPHHAKGQCLHRRCEGEKFARQRFDTGQSLAPSRSSSKIPCHQPAR